MTTKQYQDWMLKHAKRSVNKQREQFAQIERDLDTREINGISQLRDLYIDKLPPDAAESVAVLFAAISAELTKHARRDAHYKAHRESPHEDYIYRVASAPGWAVKLMREFYLDRATAISETAEYFGLTPGIVEKELLRAAKHSLGARRVEVARLIEDGFSVPEIAKRLGFERTTIWRDASRIKRRQEFPKIGRPSSSI